MGAMVTEAIEAAARLNQIGIATEAICVTSPDLLFEGRAGAGRTQRRTFLDPRPKSFQQNAPPQW